MQSSPTTAVEVPEPRFVIDVQNVHLAPTQEEATYLTGQFVPTTPISNSVSALSGSTHTSFVGIVECNDRVTDLEAELTQLRHDVVHKDNMLHRNLTYIYYNLVVSYALIIYIYIRTFR